MEEDFRKTVQELAPEAKSARQLRVAVRRALRDKGYSIAPWSDARNLLEQLVEEVYGERARAQKDLEEIVKEPSSGAYGPGGAAKRALREGP